MRRSPSSLITSGRQHEPASAIFMIIRGSFMAIRVKNKSVEFSRVATL
jgi:hypothetical protein